MTEKEKKRLMIVVAVIAAIIIVFLLLRKAGNAIYQQGTGSTNNFGGAEILMPDFERQPFVIPDFGYDPTDLSAIGACCVDCGSSARQARTSYAPASDPVTLVYNAGNKGPNIYNYYTENVVEETRPMAWFRG